MEEATVRHLCLSRTKVKDGVKTLAAGTYAVPVDAWKATALGPLNS
jgi:hypothetical protein